MIVPVRQKQTTVTNSQLWATENTQSCLGQNITKLAVKLNGGRQDVNQRATTILG